MHQTLKPIKKIQVIKASAMTNILVVPGTGVFLSYWRDFGDLHLSGLAECTVSSAVDNKNTIYTTKVAAHLCSHFDAGDRGLNFLLTAVDGERYLVGLSEPPYPTVLTEDVMPARPTDKSGCNLTIELTDTVGLLPVLD